MKAIINHWLSGTKNSLSFRSFDDTMKSIVKFVAAVSLVIRLTPASEERFSIARSTERSKRLEARKKRVQ